MSHSKDSQGPLSQLVENYYANLAHYLMFCVFSITKYCHQCAPPAVWATYRQEWDKQMQANSQTWVTWCFFFLFSPICLFLFLSICLAGSFILTHRDTLSDWCILMQNTRRKQKDREQTGRKQKGTPFALHATTSVWRDMHTWEHKQPHEVALMEAYRDK